MWKSMMARCYNPKTDRYPEYGGRGIEVCDEWHDVQVFIEWIETHLGPRPDGMSLDRIDTEHDNYEPGRVRWATASEQAVTRRPRKNESGYPGVTRNRSTWKYSIQRNGKRIGVYGFKTALEAHEARRRKLAELGEPVKPRVTRPGPR
jgi:hypothetical protein